MITLYHGTGRMAANHLLKNGWQPRKPYLTPNGGNPKYLYLTTTPGNAEWYANRSEDGVVLSVDVGVSDIMVDPEDGIQTSVEKELSQIPGNLVAIKPIPAKNISFHSEASGSNSEDEEYFEEVVSEDLASTRGQPAQSANPKPLPVVKPKILEKIFGYFHLSENDLGPTFLFTPRVPKSPFNGPDGNTSEDDFTKRISVCKSIPDCQKALGGRTSGYFVYAGSKDLSPQQISKNIPKCPRGSTDDLSGEESSPYGQNFSLSRWLEKVLETNPGLEKKYPDLRRAKSPARLPPGLAKQFKGCVPDAEETNEHWIMKPVRMIQVGRIEISGSVQLTEIGKKALGK